MRRVPFLAVFLLTGLAGSGVREAGAAIPPAERDALIALYNATNGAGWTNNAGWLGGGGTECSWYGVVCDVGATHVVGLVLQSNQLSGAIPTQLGTLSQLDNLGLFSNQLSGKIPTQLGNLASLRTLNLVDNQLTGTVPVQLAQLGNLTWLGLGGNHLSGPIPTQLGSLTLLTDLGLSINDLSGPIPTQLGNLTSLQTLGLHTNRLTGSIPTQLGNLTSLQRLEAQINQLSGSIPTQLGNLASLSVLNLHENRLTGPIPTQLGSLASLSELNLKINQLSGPVPSQLGNLTNLAYAILNHNQLSGLIPSELGGLTSLRGLSLDENRLTGAIPTQLGSLTNLRALELDWNQLSGSVPTELGSLPNLLGLELQGNLFAGSIPTELGGLASLQSLKLGYSQWSGSIPSELGALASLTNLELQNNRLSGPIPPQLGSLALLEGLQLAGNQLSGSIPTELTALTALAAGSSDFRWNALHTSDAPLRAFLNAAQDGGDWESSQTIAPDGLGAAVASPVAALLTWTPIAYTADAGGYRVYVGTTPGGPYALHGTTSGKAVSGMSVTGLAPGTPYYFVVETVTQPHAFNGSAVVSARSAEAGVTTAPPTLSIDNVKVSEGQAGPASAVFTVVLSAPTTQTVTVDYATADSSAEVADSDYVATSGALTFAPGATTRTVSVTVNGDVAAESDETFVIDLSAATDATIADARGVGTIGNDDATTLVQFSAAAYSGSEATAATTITVRRSGLLAGSLTVDYATTDGTAKAGVDYQARAGTLTFGPNVGARTFTLPVVNDTLDEPDETVALRLLDVQGAGAALGWPDTASLTIKDSDTGGVIQLGASAYTLGENKGTATITATRTGGVASDVTVTYTASGVTATDGSDFTAASGTLTFAAGQATATFQVAILNDTDPEGLETVSLALASPGGGATLGARAGALLTIVDDESTIELGAPAYVVTEGGAAAVLVKRAGSLAGTVTVHYATSDGTATSGTDYSARSGILTFASNVATRTIAIPTTTDTLNETDKTFVISLDSPGGGPALGRQTGTTVTIKDNDPAGVVQLGAASYSVAEAGGNATITVTRTGGSASGVVVMYAAMGGTATPTWDYAETFGTLTFVAGQANATFRVPIVNDTEPEGSEMIWVLVLPAGGGAAAGPRTSVPLTILDNDGSQFQFGAAAYNVSEGAALATITVRRLGLLTQSATVDYASSSGTATADEDYTAVSGTLSFPPGAASRTFPVPIRADALDEPDETVDLALGSPSASHGLGSPVAAVLKIVDNDAAGTIQFGAPAYSKVEGEDGTVSLATVTVTRAGGTSSGATVDYATSEGTATAEVDYTTTGGTLTFAAGQTSASFEVEVLGDSEAEGNEVVNLTLSNPGGRVALGALRAAQLWIAEPTGAAKLIFIHHSTGEGWLADNNGGLGLALRDNNYFVSDTNYGWGRLWELVPDPPSQVGDHTDIGEWYEWFAGTSRDTYLGSTDEPLGLYHDFTQHSSYTRLANDPDPARENEIVVFKSCFPNSHLAGAPTDPATTDPNPLRGQPAGADLTVGNAKGIYNDILEYFTVHQEKLFIVVTAPPLRAVDTTPEAAANARAFNDWLVNDWLSSYAYDNVAVFDFYNVLTSNGGTPAASDLGKETGNHHRWWKGAVQHVHPVAGDSLAYPTGDSHPSALGGKKATGEFVTLLNYYYNLWKGVPNVVGFRGAVRSAGRRGSPGPDAAGSVAPPGRIAPSAWER